MLQWQQVEYRERVDSQWQNVNQGIPQWQKVEFWYPLRIVLKGRWILAGLKLLPNQPNLFLENYLCFCHTKVKPSIFTYSSSFLLTT